MIGCVDLRARKNPGVEGNAAGKSLLKFFQGFLRTTESVGNALQTRLGDAARQRESIGSCCVGWNPIPQAPYLPGEVSLHQREGRFLQAHAVLAGASAQVHASLHVQAGIRHRGVEESLGLDVRPDGGEEFLGVEVGGEIFELELDVILDIGPELLDRKPAHVPGY